MTTDEMTLKDLGLLVIAVLVSVLIYLRQRREREPFWVKKSWALVRDLKPMYSDIRILYKDKEIRNFGVTMLGFWNGGREAIRREDIPKGMPLVVNVPGDCEVVETQVKYQSNASNNVQVDREKERIVVSFEYLDPNEGFILFITHSLPKDEVLGFTGRIIGGRPIKQVQIEEGRWGFLMVRNLIYLIWLALWMVIIGSSWFQEGLPRGMRLVILVCVTLMIGIEFPKGLIRPSYPREFRKYFNV